MIQERTNFIILYQGRSGSSFLIDSLSRHPDITVRSEMLVSFRYLVKPGEQLNLLKKLYAMGVRFWKGSPAERQLEAVKKFYNTPRNGSRAVGFKTKVRDIEAPLEMKELLESRQVKVILMERKNLIKKAVAYIYAFRLYEKTKRWNLFNEQDRLEPQYISIEEFDQMLKRMLYEHRTLHAYVDYLDAPKLSLEYADLLRDKDGWFSSIFQFLCVEPRNLDSAVLQNENDDLRQAVANFEELKSYYAGTEFEPMFDELVCPSA